MAGIIHRKVATYADQPGVEVNKGEWNDTHDTSTFQSAANAWSGLQYTTPVAITSTAGVINWDASVPSVTYTATENVTSMVITNIVEGGIYRFWYIQHASSAKTFVPGTTYLAWAPSGIVPTATTTLSGVDLYVFEGKNGKLHGIQKKDSK